MRTAHRRASYYLLIFMLLFSPHSYEFTTPTEMITSHDITDYFPLQVGNYWIARCDTFYGEYHPTFFRQDVEGTDDRGLVVASDAYFYKLTAGQLRKTKLMLLLK